jgi:hypothetical protein
MGPGSVACVAPSNIQGVKAGGGLGKPNRRVITPAPPRLIVTWYCPNGIGALALATPLLARPLDLLRGAFSYVPPSGRQNPRVREGV